MAYKSSQCPSCGSFMTDKIGERTGGFSAGKAAVGGLLLGPVGIAGGLLGKKKMTYKCRKCGYTFEL